MSNQEMIINDLKYLKDYGVRIKIYCNVESENQFIVENNGVKSNFEIKELKQFLQELKDQIDDLNEQASKKRRMFRSMLLEASEEIARKFNKQVFTVSIGECEE